MSSARSPLRLLRGSVAATLATAVALSGHLVGGGAMPSWLGVLLPWWLSVAVCTVLAGSRFSLPRMSAAVLASQALFHGLFMAGTPGDPSVQLVAPPGSHLGHGAHPAGSVADHGSHAGSHAGSQGVGTAAEHALHGNHADLRMLAWHVVAALVTALLLHRGESMLLHSFGLAGQLWAFLSRPHRTVAAPAFTLPAPRRAVPEPGHLHHARRAVLAPQQRRGPPLVLAA
ncbi:hypothetical protein [Brachybacterium sp. FME24]|uniref:hypothetical protein n=1 Tax=Brachybacterium sp. FME24 TaxID=2742605 RepID=UPI001867E122|nr:hypothetical protein [Brachybacterium sp. FME24]